MSLTTRRQFLKLGAAALASLALPAHLVHADAPTANAVFSGKPTSPVLALTFDDGYVNVSRFLDVCREANVRLTLFPIGQVIEANPAPWQRAVAEGHEIGCHTYTHQPLSGQPYEVVANELAEFMRVARSCLGLSMVQYFRPPCGSGWNEPALQQAAADFGMTVMMWNRVNAMNQFSAEPTGRDVVSAFQQQARLGDIFLYHFRYQEVDALATIVEFCRGQNWHVGTISELLERTERLAPSPAQTEDNRAGLLKLNRPRWQ
jgi:peptidoglycan/xylan/chitin deacetylase (PgdA/CDA1 family)